MSDDLKDLVTKVKGSAAPEAAEGTSKTDPPEQSKEETWVDLQCEVRAAVERANAICSAGEAAISDAYIKLQSYVTNKMPLLILDAIDKTAKEHIKHSVDDLLLPLKEGTDGIVNDVDTCRAKLRKMSWNWRLFVAQVGTGLVVIIIGGCLVYFGLLREQRRYAIYGKKVAGIVDTYNPKTREILLQDFGRP